jgi:hypothetical protein
MKNSFLGKIAYANGLWAIGLALLFLAALREFFFPTGEIRLLWDEAYTVLNDWSVFGVSVSDLMRNALFFQVFRFLLLVGCGLLLQYISSEFRLIRIRSFFPLFLFSLFAATLLPALPLQGAALSCFLFCWACLRLFGSLEHNETYRGVFDASALLALASLTQSRLLFLMPVIWIVMGILQVFSLRSFLASLLGVLSVFWVLAGVSFLLGNFDFLLMYCQDLIAFKWIDFNIVTPAELTYISFLGLLMISAMISFWPSQHLDKLRTRNYLNSILLLWFALLTLWLFSGNDMSYLLILLSLSALVVAHFFSLVNTFYSRIMFLMFLALSVSVYLIF